MRQARAAVSKWKRRSFILCLDATKFSEVLKIYNQSLDFKKHDFARLDFFSRDSRI